MPDATPTPEFTTANLVALDAAISSGALIVHYQDRSVEYRSADDLLKLRAAIKQAISLASGPAIIRQGRIYTRQGW